MAHEPTPDPQDPALPAAMDGYPLVAIRSGASGRRCFGYSADGKDVIPEEAAVIREVAAKFLGDASLRGLVMEMNDRGLRTTSYGVWQTITLRRLLTNPRLAGLRTYRNKVIGTGDWAPILERETFDAICAKLADPARDTNTTGSRTRKALLTGGMLLCGGQQERDGRAEVCGMPLHSQPSNNGKPGYACKNGPLGGCGRIRVAAEPLEAEVAAQCLARLASPRIRARIEAAAGIPADEGVQALHARAQNLANTMAELADDYYVRKIIGRSEFLSTRSRLNAQLEQVRESITLADRLQALPDLSPAGLTQWWEEHEQKPTQRRELIATVLDHLVVGPSTRRGFTGLDEGRLTWVWR